MKTALNPPSGLKRMQPAKKSTGRPVIGFQQKRKEKK